MLGNDLVAVSVSTGDFHVEKPLLEDEEEEENRRRTLGSAMLKLKPFFRYMKNDIDFTVYEQHTRQQHNKRTCVCVEKLVGLNCLRSGDKCVGLSNYKSLLSSRTPVSPLV